MIRTMIRLFAFAVAATLVAAAATSQIQPGDQSRWSLDFQSRMEQHSAPPIAIHVTGGWTSTVTAVRAGEYDAQLQLADVQLTGDAANGAPSASLAGLRARLSRPFWATYRNDGKLLEMHFFRDQSSSDRNLLQMIATELQLVRPDSARVNWTAQERDGAGEYSALYLRPRPDRILKRKLKYIYTDGVAGAPADALHVVIDQSDITFTINSNGRVQAVDGTDRVRMDLSPDHAEQLTAITDFHASHLQTARASEFIGSLERAHANVIDSPIVTHKLDDDAARAEADERLLSGHTTEDLLDSAFAKDPGSAAQPDRLAALFRRRPEAADVAAALLIKNGSQKIVTNALGAAGSLSAVAALSGLAQNATLPQDLRVDAIVAFVQMQHPMVEAMHVPGDLFNDSNIAVRSAARMMSGAISRTGRPEHPAEADLIDAALINLYQNAPGVHEKTELLSALGNSAGPSVIPAIEEALRDSRVLVRSAAARALRLARGSDVDRVLANVITSDPDAQVRADAIFATRFRHPLPPPIADALLHAASADETKFIRSDAIAVLSQNPTASVRIPETLARIADLDTDSGIRRQARQLLERLPAIASSHSE
jgi:HEAT repeat protein